MERMVIKGSEWHRGGRDRWDESAALLTRSGRRCCLGIHGRLCGIPDDVLLYAAYPFTVRADVTECYLPWIDRAPNGSANTPIASRAAKINDNLEITDDERIAQLRPIFHKVGVSIVWRPDL